MIGPSPARDALDPRSLRVAELVHGSVENLRATYRQSDGLFPYSTRLSNGRFVSDYATPGTVRYTINSLLGLAEAASAGIETVTRSEVDSMIETFLAEQLHRVDQAGDLGLLAVLASGHPSADGVAADAVARLGKTIETSGRDLDLQSLSWTIWGGAAAARAGIDGAEQLARATADLVAEHFVDEHSGLPRHTTSRYRRRIVSFGAVAYYLRALHELERSFGDERSADAFRLGVERALSMQGPQGEWPWMIDARTGSSFDVYPVFLVHQDSMAMLFLLPAADAGVAGAPGAIRRSIAWGFGENELGTSCYRWSPFVAMRSIERVERAPRARRYGRALAYRLRPGRAAGFGKASVRVNPECRSYHLGWILYVWSRRVANAGAREAE
jgi:hypothetical protein